MSNYTELLVKKNYANDVGGAALFFQTNKSQAVRVEVPGILKEFSDGAYLGTDPEGILYYDKFKDLDGHTSYLVKQDKTKDNIYVAHIIFYKNSADKPYAEFLGKDIYQVVTTSGWNDKSSSGDWKDLQIGSSYGTVTRSDSSTTVTFTFPVIKKKATITLGVITTDSEGNDYASDFENQTTIDVKGSLSFRSLDTLADGKYASWAEDRVVFYKDDYRGTDFTAYFIPAPGSKTALGIADGNQIFANVAWSDA